MNTFSGHLKELKNELFKGAVLFALFTLLLLFYSKNGLDFALSKGISYGYSIMTQSPQEYFVEKIKFSFVGALLICMPIYICMLIGYVSEEKIIKKLMIFTSIFVLYGAGILFSSSVMLPFCLEFLAKISKETSHLIVSISLAKYMDFIYSFLVSLAIFAEMPVLCGAFAKTGLVTGELLIKHWKMAVLIIGIISMFLTPPDPVSLALMMIPLLMIYCLCIIVLKHMNKQKKGEERS